MQLLFIGDFLSEVFVGIIMVLDTVIYSLVSSAYKIFMAIASARLLSSEVYYEIASRIYIIIGVLMLFVLSYAILKAIVDPDKATKGELGPDMVKRVIIAVIGLAITPVLFNVLYQAQGLFLEQDVLGKVFFRIQNTESIEVNGVSGNPDEQIKNIGGAVAATSIWQAFFHPAEGYSADDIKSSASEYVGKAIGTLIACGLGILGILAAPFTAGTTLLLSGATVALCAASVAGDADKATQIASQGGDVTLTQAYATASGGGSFDIFLIFIDNYVEDDEIEYFWGVSTLCGAFALYAFASFSIDMGVRAAKLAYYQIIAPIPLIMQVLPEYKKSFEKYIKNVVSTFLEVFIRISVVYIVVYVVCHLQDLFSSFGSLWGNESLNLAEKSLALAFLILGLVIFAKSAPDIICQSLNIEKGSMNLGIGKKLAEGGSFAAGAIGRAGVTSAVENFNSTKGNWRKKALSALGGFGSGSARAAFSQFGPGPNRKEAKTWGDMMNVSDRASQASADKRNKRDDRQKDHASALEALSAAQAEADAAVAAYSLDPNDVNEQKMKDAEEKLRAAQKRVNETTAVGAMLDNAGKRLQAWSVGTIDTSKMDAQAKLFDDLKSLEGKLEDTVGRDDNVKNAQRAVDRLARTDVSDYAYSIDLNKRADAAVIAAKKAYGAANFRAQNVGESDDDYLSEIEAWNSTRSDSERAAYATATNRDTLYDTLRNSTFKRSDYSVDVDSDDYRTAVNRLNADMKKADDDLKAAKKDAVARRLAEAATGIENDTSRALNAFFSSQQASIRENANADMGNGFTLERYLQNNFGASITSGVVDFSQMLKESGSDYEFKLSGASKTFELNGFNFNANAELTVNFDKSSGKFKVSGVDAGGNHREDEISETQLRNLVNSAEFSKTSDSKAKEGGIVKVVKGVTDKLKDAAEKSGDKLRNSESYRDAHEKARQQRENKK